MKRRFIICGLLVAFGGFAIGLFRLFELRYETGDIYPEYSSLRADPLGTMALYEALKKMPGLTVRRDHSADNQLPRGRGITYLHLAASRLDWFSMDEELLKEVEGFVTAGGRLVIAFVPESSRWFAAPAPAPPPAPGKKKSSTKKQDERRRSPETAWGFEFSRLPLPRSHTGTLKPVSVTREADLPLPKELSWHSPMVFTNLDQSWHAIYTRGPSPVLVERKLGPGTIVMVGDCYFLSNEALLVDREPELLAWLVGPSRDVLFDEAHLGIVENPGMATLMRKYRLHWFGAALLLLAALFIWQNATSFPPPFACSQQNRSLVGKDAAGGFVNLLRRNISPADLLRVCFDEWTKSLTHSRSHSIARVDAAQAVFEAENARAKTSRDPVRAYREICAALKGDRQ